MSRGSRVCCVYKCEEDDNIPLFGFSEKNPKKYKSWLHAIGHNLKDIPLHKRCSLLICIKHFSNDCFCPDPAPILKDGVEVVIPRRRQTLKQGSVPTIFQVQNLQVPCDLKDNKFDNNEYTINNIINDWKSENVANFKWRMMIDAKGDLDAGVVFTSSGYTNNFARVIHVKSDMTVEVQVFGRVCKLDIPEKATSFQVILKSLTHVSLMDVCEVRNCEKVLYKKLPKSSSNKCKDCQLRLRREAKKIQARQRYMAERKLKCNKAEHLKQLRRKLRRTVEIQERNTALRSELRILKERYASIEETTFDSLIETFPLPMQESIKACYKFSKLKKQTSKQGLRYSEQWIEECQLLRLQSRKAYLHLRKRNILVLPSLETLNKFSNTRKASYGFEEIVITDCPDMEAEEIYDESQICEDIYSDNNGSNNDDKQI